MMILLQVAALITPTSSCFSEQGTSRGYIPNDHSLVVNGSLTVAVVTGSPHAIRVFADEAYVELSFDERPSTNEVFASFKKLAPHKIYFRLVSKTYAGYTEKDSIGWELLDWDRNMCFARLANSTPPSSPERPVGKRLIPSDGLAELTPFMERLALTGMFGLCCVVLHCFCLLR